MRKQFAFDPAVDFAIERFIDAPPRLVWEALTRPEHLKEWYMPRAWGRVVRTEMDVRPGGRWKHVMRFPDGFELHMDFVFVEVEAPSRLAWQHADHGRRKEGPPTSHTTVTLEDVGGGTCVTIVSRFESLAAREAAVAMGFTKPIEASNDRFDAYLRTLDRR